MNWLGPTTSGRRSLAASGVAVTYAVCFVAIKAGLAFAPPLFPGAMLALGSAEFLGLALAALTFGEQVGVLEGVGVAFTLAGIGAVAWES